MALLVDPERNEVAALARAARWRGKRVLEAVDPDPARVRAARRALPSRYAGRVRYRTGAAEGLPHPNGTFDRVVFAWSL